jgi:hypothetical protein
MEVVKREVKQCGLLPLRAVLLVFHSVIERKEGMG